MVYEISASLKRTLKCRNLNFAEKMKMSQSSGIIFKSSTLINIYKISLHVPKYET